MFFLSLLPSPPAHVGARSVPFTQVPATGPDPASRSCGRPARGTLGALRWLGTRAIAAVTVVAVVVVVWPWAASPFSSPKWLVTGSPRSPRSRSSRETPAARGRGRRRAGQPRRLPRLVAARRRPVALVGARRSALVACFALSAAPMPWSAIAWAGGLAAAVVLLQALGAYPFAPFAPEVQGTRLRLYGTLGNPDFVASVLGVTAPLSAVAAAGRAGRGRRSWGRRRSCSFSRSPCSARSPRCSRSGLRCSSSCSPGEEAAPARARARPRRGPSRLRASARPPLRRNRPAGPPVPVDHRSAPRRGCPWLGRGPGAVVLHWPAWELARWQARCGADAPCVAAHPESRFAGLQDHVHDDWLERLLEGGRSGSRRCWPCSSPPSWRRCGAGRWRGWASRRGSLSLAARATVDFPLSRPADLVLLAVLIGAAGTSLPKPWTLTALLRETPRSPEGSHESTRGAAGARRPCGRR